MGSLDPLGVRMGPLWAWVILWLVSIYGLVLLLRSALSRAVQEPVPVLVATPKPPESPATEPEEVAVGEPPEAAVPAESALAPEETVPAPALQEPPLAAAEPPAREAAASDDPWVKLQEPPLESEPWVVENEEGDVSEPWIREREANEVTDPWSPEADEPLVSDGSRQAADEDVPVPSSEGAPDGEPVVYRSIDLESLTLGLAAAEVQELYGSPGHLSKVGEDGEQWRYPLNATDQSGEGIDGVLVLEFQRGRLVRKALEEGES